MILKNCRLVPDLCEGFQQETADIRIEGNTIAEVLPAGGKYAGEEVIDCSGKTVLPGLFNLHYHLWFNGPRDMRLPKKDVYEQTVQAIRYMNEMMAYGFTSIRDVGTPFNIAIRLREQINAGELVGPDLRACGIILTPDHIAPAFDCYSADHGEAVNSPYQVRALARRQIAEGADFIKILGCSVAPGRRGSGTLFYEDEMAELVNVVKREGVYLAVHAETPESIGAAVESEVHTIEHGSLLSLENVDQIIAHNYKTKIVPTLHIFMGEPDGEQYAREFCSGIRNAYDAGILLGWGTDASEMVFLKEPATEFTSRAKILGIPNIDLLKQATINSAIINGTDDLRGSIKVGKRADFAIVDGNPDEDLTVFNKPCAYVLKDGIVVAREGMIKSV